MPQQTAKAGYRFIAWGTNHKEDSGKPVPVLANDAPPEKAKELARHCRDLGLEPVLMFGPPPEDPAALKHRVRQAAGKSSTFRSEAGYSLGTARPDVRVPVQVTVARLHVRPKTLALITVRDAREQRALQGRLQRAEEMTHP